jgi:hypothetical protein
MIIRYIDSPKPRLLSLPLNPTLNKMQPPATRKKLIKISQFSSSIQVIQPNHCLFPSILQKKAISIHLTPCTARNFWIFYESNSQSRNTVGGREVVPYQGADKETELHPNGSSQTSLWMWSSILPWGQPLSWVCVIPWGFAFLYLSESYATCLFGEWGQF